MFDTVIGFATSSENQPVTAMVPQFKNGVTALKDKVANINATIAAQGTSNLGFAEFKSMI